MGWLYSVSRSPKNLGEIIKEKGEIRMKSGKRWDEQDRYYFSPGGTDNSIKWVPLTYGFKPTDGLMVRRRVFLEVENDEKALRMISNDYEKAIEAYEERVSYFRHLISVLTIKTEDPDGE